VALVNTIKPFWTHEFFLRTLTRKNKNSLERDYVSVWSTASPGEIKKIADTRVNIPAPATTKQVHKRIKSNRLPRGFEKILHKDSENYPSKKPQRSTKNPYELYIRQQPLATRACCTVDRDRRPIDPPPIVQLLLQDLDPVWSNDHEILQDPRFAVGCLLYPLSDSSYFQKATATPHNRYQEKNISNHDRPLLNDSPLPLLSGKAFVSPFYVDTDPDPKAARKHASSEYLNSESPCGYEHDEGEIQYVQKPRQPATFFIFTDLSISSPGLYRLQFRLMNWGLVEDTGQPVPILAETWSEPFRVYSAKDFPGMSVSSPLTKGLKDLGFHALMINRLANTSTKLSRPIAISPKLKLALVPKTSLIEKEKKRRHTKKRNRQFCPVKEGLNASHNQRTE
jgi:hypothetical protein